jgi:hypothetical protein
VVLFDGFVRRHGALGAGRRQRDDGVVDCISRQRQEDRYLSVVSLGEIERGIERRRELDPAWTQELASWFDRLLRLRGPWPRRHRSADRGRGTGAWPHGGDVQPAAPHPHRRGHIQPLAGLSGRLIWRSKDREA